MEQTLGALLAVGKEIDLVCGRHMEIKPFRFRQFGQVSAILKKINFKIDGDIDLQDLMAHHCEDIIEIIKIATGFTDAELDELDIDDAVILVLTIMEVNKDFFVQRLAPQLESMKTRLSGKL